MALGSDLPLDPAQVQFGPPLQTAPGHEGAAAQIADLGDGLATRQAVRQLDHGALGIAEQQDVGLGVEQDRAAHLLGPVVEMRDAPQAGLDASQDDACVPVRLARPLRIDGHRAVRPATGLRIRGIGVVRTQTPIGGIAVDHGVHVAGGHAEEEIGPAEPPEILGRGPVRLRENADPKPLGLQQTADDGHAEGGMVHVGVAGDHDDVAAVPPEEIHLGTRHRQLGRDPETVRPVLAVGENIGGALHGRSDPSAVMDRPL
ncbi:hypothetical protein D779_3434 [Imhoffiella purpurea]|uniref:Uncharacterized protein n=1 Tax=Imhoffiella purpurea TaxID=1249627 RepID=W9VKY9_9GAMM|nr:hypothetical protein D779_3434 [Imhoffiella purpurea]